MARGSLGTGGRSELEVPVPVTHIFSRLTKAQAHQEIVNCLDLVERHVTSVSRPLELPRLYAATDVLPQFACCRAGLTRLPTESAAALAI